MSDKFSLKNHFKKITVDGAMAYLFLMFLPVIVAMALGVYYQSAGFRIYKDVLCFPEILFNGLAACCFHFYLTHTERFRVSSEPLRLLFSYAYAFSSYLLIQENQISILALYTLLPLLFLTYENFLSGGRAIPFVLLLACCFLLNLSVTGVLTFYLCLVFFFETEQTTLGRIIADFAHFLSLLAFAFLLSGFLTIPRIFDYITLLSENTTVTYSNTYPVITFLSRFLFGSISYQMLGYSSGISLYVGLFVLLCVFLYFVNPAFSARERIKTSVCLVLLLGTMELSPLVDLLTVRDSEAPETIPYCFFLLFLLLRLGILGIEKLQTLSARRRLLGWFCSLLLISLVFVGTLHNFSVEGVIGNYLFLLLYGGLLLVFGKRTRFTAFLPKLTLAFGMAELLFSAYLSTNASLVPYYTEEDTHFLWEWDWQALISVTVPDSTDIAESEPESEQVHDAALTSLTTLPYEEEYYTFLSQNQATSFITNVNRVKENVSLTKEEISARNPYSLLSTSENINLLCEKAGASEPLLIPEPDLSVVFAPCDLYQITDQGHHIYNLACKDKLLPYTMVYVACEITIPEQKPFLIIENHSGSCFLFRPKTPGETFSCYLKIPNVKEGSFNFEVSGCYLNEDLLQKLPSILDTYETELCVSATFCRTPYYAGILCTAIGLFLMLCFCLNRDSQKLINLLLDIKNRFTALPLWERLASHCRDNRVYYLAFCIPFCLFLFTLIFFRCEPFGPYSLLSQDGIGSIFPDYLNFYNNIKSGNFILNRNAGFAAGMFPSNIFRFPLLLLRADQISTALVLAIGLMLSFASFNMVYYLTHRLYAEQASKSDYRLLVPALIYALNTFILSMSGYVDWISTYMVLPLIFCALDQLIYRKKWLSYVLLLSFCMYNTIQLALYICIALFILFFTYRFDNFMDLLKKGIRFALCSILSASISIITVGGNLFYAMGETAYANSDSVAPQFRLFGSFLEQWKNLMIFSPSSAVSSSKLHINLYMGIITLLLIVTYFAGKGRNLRQKGIRLLFLAMLLFSFNEEITAYVINGFHYQSNVPNRHAFLLIFLCAVISYDGILATAEISRRKTVLLSAATVSFFCLCQFASSGNTAPAFGITVALVCIYGIIGFLRCNTVRHSLLAGDLTVVFLTVELACNMLYTVSDFSKDVILNFGNYPEQSVYNNETLGLRNSGYRAITPAYAIWGDGSFTNTPGITAFTPYLSSAQKNMSLLYGYYHGANYLLSNYDATPLGNALASVKYIFLKRTALFALPDLELYNYLGFRDGIYIFENPWVFPLGVYAPPELTAMPDADIDVVTYSNWLSYVYLKDTNSLPFDVGYFNESSLSGKDQCTYTDADGTLLTPEEASSILEESLNNPGMYFPVRDLTMDLTLYPPRDGFLYLYAEEFAALGKGTAENAFRHTLYYPAPSDLYTNSYVVFHPEAMDALYETVMQNAMENIVIHDNHITGTTNYEKDGYTMFSLPYAETWKAYIDGKETPVISSLGSFLMVETPAGNHTLELIYPIPLSTKIYIGISLGSLAFAFLCYGISVLLEKKKSQKGNIQEEQL